ncbi:MAG: hypothetical protein ACJ8EB_00345 [Allosphingosinicella sp.]
MRRAIAGAAAAAVVAMSAAPAAARGGYHHYHHDDIDAGDVFTGVAVVGGIAALFSAISQGNVARQDAAVDVCSHEAESRLGGPVAEVGHVSKSKGYYTVEGIVAVEQSGVRAPFSCTVRNGTLYGFRGAETPPPSPQPQA